MKRRPSRWIPLVSASLAVVLGLLTDFWNVDPRQCADQIHPDSAEHGSLLLVDRSGFDHANSATKPALESVPFITDRAGDRTGRTCDENFAIGELSHGDALHVEGRSDHAFHRRTL